MPFIPIQPASRSLLLGLWRIEEDESYFLDRLNIYENERQILDSISHPLKRLEWLSSRLCLKELLQIHHKVESLNHSNGKPYLTDNSFHISYSHSNLVSGAIASNGSWVSIDLEDLTRQRNPETRRLFMHPGELKLYEQTKDPRFFFLIWSAKETLYKIHPERGLVFRENLIIVPETGTLKQNGMLKGIINKNGLQKEYSIHYGFHEDVVLTYTSEPVFMQQPVA